MVHALLEVNEAVEWARIGEFQNVTMRLIAEFVLPATVRGATYLEGEITQLRDQNAELKRLIKSGDIRKATTFC